MKSSGIHKYRSSLLIVQESITCTLQHNTTRNQLAIARNKEQMESGIQMKGFVLKYDSNTIFNTPSAPLLHGLIDLLFLCYCILTWWFSRYICVVINVKNAPAFFSSPFSTTILTRDTTFNCEMYVHLSIKYCWCLVDSHYTTRSLEFFIFPTKGDLILIHL